LVNEDSRMDSVQQVADAAIAEAVRKALPTVRRGHAINELASSYGLSHQFLRNEIRRGKLRARRFGRRVIVLDEDWRAYLEQADAR
jgi:hypothetical protein